jgi:hypothetical protein
MEDAERIAVAGYSKVLGDGPESCSSESSAEHSDRGEEYSASEMYTPDMLDAKGKPVLARATLTTEQALALHARGRAGGQVTDVGKG